MKHVVFAHLLNGERVRFEIVAETRKEAKQKLCNRLRKLAAIAPKYLFARVPKFNETAYLMDSIKA